MTTATWTRETVALELARSLVDRLGAHEHEVTPQAKLANLITCNDSLDTVEFIMAAHTITFADGRTLTDGTSMSIPPSRIRCWP